MDLYDLQAKLSLDSTGYDNGVDDAMTSANELANGLEDATGTTDGLAEGLNEIPDGSEQSSGWSMLGEVMSGIVTQGIMSALGAIKQFAAESVEAGMNFESSMANVQAISGASGEELEMLTDTAKEAGQSTVFSASEAADALGYMALAGWDAEQSASGLDGVLNLAAASGMELAEASDMVTDYLSAFGMEASDASYFADMLSSAQSSSNTTAELLGEAYKNCAANLHAAGQDVQTVTSLLEGMANQGLKGSEAGTALAAVMRDITNSMEDGSIMIGDTSVAVADSEGNFRDLTEILRDVESATNGMGTSEQAAALGATFTSDSIKGLNLILNEGVDNIAGYEESLNDCDGAAEDMANTMNDTLAGDIKSFQSHVESLQLALYDLVEPLMRIGVAIGTTLVDGLTNTSTLIGECITEYENYKNGIDDVVVSESDYAVAMNYAQYMTAEQRAALQSYAETASTAETQTEETTDAVDGLGDAATESAAEADAATAQAEADALELAEEIKQGAQDIRGSLQSMWTDANEDEVVGLSDFTTNLQSQTATLRQWTADMQTLGQMAADGLINDSLLAELQSAGPESAALVSEIVNADSDALTELNSAYSENAQAATDAYLTELGNGATEIDTFWSDLATTSATASTEAGTTDGEGYDTSVAAGVTASSAEVSSAVTSVVTSAIQTGNTSAGEATSIGTYIVQGIIQGINSASGTLYTTMRTIISNGLAAAKEEAGIASPSKLFAKEVGRWIPAGIGVGIEDGAGSLMDTMQGTVDSLTGVNLPGMGSITTTRNGVYTTGNAMSGLNMVLTDSAGTVFARTAKDSLNAINGRSLQFARRGLAGY